MQTLAPHIASKGPLYVGAISKKPVNKDSIEAMTKEKDRMVKGTFKNLECPNQPAFVGCRMYKGQPIFQRWFQDGEEAEIPLSVARHINENTTYNVHGYLLDSDGNYVKGAGRQVQRYAFNSLDFK